MSDDRIRWTKAAKAMGGLAAVLTLLAHFWLPSLPLTVVRVELLLLLIGVLLGIDMLSENSPVTFGGQQNDDGNEENDTHDR